MSLWESYRALAPRTRILIGTGIMAYAVFGMFLSDKAEQTLGLTPTEQDKKSLRDVVPKIRTVEREGK